MTKKIEQSQKNPQPQDNAVQNFQTGSSRGWKIPRHREKRRMESHAHHGNNKSEENDKLKKDDEFKGWVGSTITTFRCISQKDIGVCSISIVPEHLRKSNKDAYSPKFVSIGPMHRKTKRDLLYTKEAKWRSMLILLERAGSLTQKALNSCMVKMYEVDDAVRASYVDDDLKLVGRYDMAKIMLLDGCFLLELLISHEPDENFECTLSKSFRPIKKKGELLFDLVLLENQIPFLVLRDLFIAIFPEKISGEKKDTAKETISKFVLSLFGCSPVPNSFDEIKSSHLLELLHSFMTKSTEPVVVEASSDNSTIDVNTVDQMKSTEPVVVEASSDNSTIDVDTVDQMKSTEPVVVEASSDNSYETRCATKLHAAGVEIKCRPIEQNEVNEFNFHIEFDVNEKSLKIPKLQITKTTEAKWRNFIAWEHDRCDRTQIIPLLEGEEKVNCKFSWYALFIQKLICCEHDVQLLRDKDIIVVDKDANSVINHDKEEDNKKKKKSKNKGMSNKELMIMLNKIAHGVDSDKIQMDLGFEKLFKKLSEHQSTRNCVIERVLLFWHWVRWFLTSVRYKWEISYDILKKQYTPTMWKKIGIVYAVILLGLTIAQVVLAAIAM